MSTRLRRPDYDTVSDLCPIELIESDFDRSRKAAILLHNESVIASERSRRRRALALYAVLPTVIIILLAIVAG